MIKKMLFNGLLMLVIIALTGCASPLTGSYLLASGKPMQKINPAQLSAQEVEYRLGPKDVLLLQVYPLETATENHKIEKGNQLRINFNYDKSKKESYKIVAGDELSLEFPEDVATLFQVTVSPDGKMTLPRLGKTIAAEGLTIGALNKLSVKEYKNLYLSPKASWAVTRSFSEQLTALTNNYSVGSDGDMVIDRLGGFNVLGKLSEQVAKELSARASQYYHNEIIASVSVAKVNTREQPDSRLTPGGLEMYLNPNNIPNRIAEDGTVFVPYFGNVQASGKTVRALRDEISSKVQSHYQNPVSVNVAIQEYADHNVFIGGEVRQPGRYPFSQRMSLLKLIAMAGWANEFGDMANVVLLRAGGDNDYVIYRTNLTEVIEAKGPAAQDFKMTPQDLVVVLPTDVAKANRYVSQYIKGILPFGANVSYNFNNRTSVSP